ncbi:endonuclease-reverse transcriptase [Elysia marginata]|uniref:Endonuclease-reverse transcriptase n=1 Tax=Elysia marginata TaxID=1093978 RepID=A0AAV4GNS5_9GAST|nr:endonuclease-reverse transcriptase [Elysia marginata]
MANSLKEVLVSTAEEVLGRKRRTIQPWVTNEVLDLCDKRRELRKRKFGSNVAMENYQLANKAVRKKMKKAKEKWIEDQCVSIEQGMSSGKLKQAFSTLKMLTKTFQPKVNLVADKEGRLLTDDEDIMQRWSEYCSDMYNYELQPDLSILSATRDPPETDDSPPIQKSEVEAAVKSMKLGKAPGLDNIPSELLKAAVRCSLRSRRSGVRATDWAAENSRLSPSKQHDNVGTKLLPSLKQRWMIGLRPSHAMPKTQYSPTSHCPHSSKMAHRHTSNVVRSLKYF